MKAICAVTDYRVVVVVDPNEEKAEDAESAEVSIEKANLHMFPRVRARAVAEGVRYLHLCLGHASKRAMAQAAKSCVETLTLCVATCLGS